MSRFEDLPSERLSACQVRVTTKRSNLLQHSWSQNKIPVQDLSKQLLKLITNFAVIRVCCCEAIAVLKLEYFCGVSSCNLRLYGSFLITLTLGSLDEILLSNKECVSGSYRLRKEEGNE